VELQLADPMRARLTSGERLFQMLVEPVRRWIPAGSRVVIAPDGALHRLNMEALPIPGSTPRYWLEEVTVEIAPSLAVLANATPRAAGERRLLLLGDPTGAQPPLRYAAAEMESVRRGFAPAEQAVFRGQQATPEAYRAAGPRGFSAIHFAAHATANQENPLESAVLLANGKLYARDVMETPLAADLVTVSACRGAGSRTFSGEGLVGFAWAFLRAGARHVIAGLWEVDDQSTSLLMDVLYREMAAGKTPAAALRAAKLALLASGGNFRKPYYWAPFQLYTAAP
jgi:CHAT domain-containing protein